MMREEEKYTTLDTEQCKWWVNHLFNMAKEKACNSHNFDDAQEIQSAQDKIIKSLEQKSYEDAVSRKEVIDILDNYDGLDNTIEEFIDSLKNIYEALPSVTTTHKKGKWIGTHPIGFGEFAECEVELIDGFVADNCHCSECGEELEKGERGIYCPNCGAEMESEE